MSFFYKAQTMVKNGRIRLFFFRTFLRLRISKKPRVKKRLLLGVVFQNFLRAFASLLCKGIPKALTLFIKEIHHKKLYQLINKRSIVAEKLNKKGGGNQLWGYFPSC